MLDAPVLSVDYSLAPQYPYPHALNECFYAYAWALANPSKLGWSGERICVTGDSAGGNLATAVALKCIQESLRRPDGIVLFYPVLSVEIAVSPSRFLSLMDPLLPQVRCPVRTPRAVARSVKYSLPLTPISPHRRCC